VILALLILVVLVALPLYLWRRPRPVNAPEALGGSRASSEPARDVAVEEDAGSAVSVFDAGAGAGHRIVLSEAKITRCFRQGGGRVSAERCDSLGPFQDALSRAIRESVSCAPPSASQFTVSFVLTVDFQRKSTHLWSGRSGSLRRRAAADLVRCVERTIGLPDWNGASHQYGRYDINVIAAYPGLSATLPPAGGT
jgi:hypothetical protein